MKFVAHRGDQAAGRENSIAAFRAAVSNPCVDMIELDVRHTKAGWIVFHDQTLTRLFGRNPVGMRWIHDLNCEELASLEIPFLQQVLEEFAPQIELYLDLKGKMTRDDLAELLRLVAPYGSQVALAAFDREKIEHLLDLRFHSQSTITKIAWITDNNIRADDWYFVKQLDFLAIGAEQLTSMDLMRIQALHVDVYTYTLNDHLLWHHYRKMGVDGILTDCPSLPEN